MFYSVKLSPVCFDCSLHWLGVMLPLVFVQLEWSHCSADAVPIKPITCTQKKPQKPKWGVWVGERSLNHGVVMQGVWYLTALVPLCVDSQADDVFLGYAVCFSPSVL